MNWEIFGAMLSMFGVFSGLMIWFMTRLENRIHSDISAIQADSNAKWIAINGRMDQMGARIDTTQAIIMRMLEKKGM